MRPFLVLLALALTGCAGREPEVRTVRAEVPVLVPCKTKEVAVPPWASAGLKKSDSLEVKVRALLAERRQRIGYERQLVAAAQACQ
ncbi:hypothetical protein BOP96_12495 [Pseudomonas sp. FSL W5-0203]|uniref:hypothetical protein n=1 Tax=Pseudomonas sp. FSL W5-0203 TaxID=1920491 RepID=UPI000936B14E|nr:hypothetical protein [Pseudomonas sp. FSL W5-0203]OJT30263.1 hypothetical protein BOP96_12495 [Pseudomonas sp. FSL W5-0203]